MIDGALSTDTTPKRSSTRPSGLQGHCVHRLFPCDLFPCAVVTRSDDGGRNRTTWRRDRSDVVKLCSNVHHHLIWSQVHIMEQVTREQSHMALEAKTFQWS